MLTDSGSVASLYRGNLAAVAGYFMARTGDCELAADLTAETFATALAASHRRRPGCPTTTWLYVIARTTLAESLRRGRVDSRRRRALGMSPTALIHEDIERLQQLRLAQEGLPLALLADLPADVREVLSASVGGAAPAPIVLQLSSSDWVCGDEPASSFFDQTEMKLMDAAARRAHLPWRRRLRRPGPVALRIGSEQTGIPR